LTESIAISRNEQNGSTVVLRGGVIAADDLGARAAATMANSLADRLGWAPAPHFRLKTKHVRKEGRLC